LKEENSGGKTSLTSLRFSEGGTQVPFADQQGEAQKAPISRYFHRLPKTTSLGTIGELLGAASVQNTRARRRGGLPALSKPGRRGVSPPRERAKGERFPGRMKNLVERGAFSGASGRGVGKGKKSLASQEVSPISITGAVTSSLIKNLLSPILFPWERRESSPWKGRGNGGE